MSKQTKNSSYLDEIAENMDEFKKLYEACPKDGEFEFRNGKYFKEYAKYVIEFIEKGGES